MLKNYTNLVCIIHAALSAKSVGVPRDFSVLR